MKKQEQKAVKQLQLYASFVNGVKVVVEAEDQESANLIFNNLRNGKRLKKQN